MNRTEYYSAAAKNLGVLAFLHFEYQKRAKHSAPFNLTSKKLNFPVSARPRTSDLGVFYQIFVFNEYRCVSRLSSPKLIIDLGANVGYSSTYFLSQFAGCKVIAVEPDPANFAALKHNVAPYRERVTTIQAAVWPRSEKLALNHGGEGTEWGVSVSPAAGGAVKTITVPDLLKMSGQDRISLLKIDIEGAETELFRSDIGWLSRVDNLVIELHGDEASKIFHSAVADSGFAISTCDELTVCLSASGSRTIR